MKNHRDREKCLGKKKKEREKLVVGSRGYNGSMTHECCQGQEWKLNWKRGGK